MSKERLIVVEVMSMLHIGAVSWIFEVHS